jgi:hypothetical protein
MLSRVKRRVTDYFCDFLSSLDSWGVDQVHALDALEAVTLIVTEILAEVVRFGVCAPAAVGVYPIGGPFEHDFAYHESFPVLRQCSSILS